MSKSALLKNKPGKYTVEQIKKGRRLYGAVVTFDDGRKCYLAYRHQAEIFRDGANSITEAIRKGDAAWAYDCDTVYQMCRKGLDHVGVIVRETGDIWMTRIEMVLRAPIKDFEHKGGARQFYLPLRHFFLRRGALKLKAR